MVRVGILMFGVLRYFVFFLPVCIFAVGFVGGFKSPTSLDAAPTLLLSPALAINFRLFTAFAIQHSGMARPAFKDGGRR